VNEERNWTYLIETRGPRKLQADLSGVPSPRPGTEGERAGAAPMPRRAAFHAALGSIHHRFEFLFSGHTNRPIFRHPDGHEKFLQVIRTVLTVGRRPCSGSHPGPLLVRRGRHSLTASDLLKFVFSKRAGIHQVRCELFG
jgi:hypothetical protein